MSVSLIKSYSRYAFCFAILYFVKFYKLFALQN